MKRAGFIFFIAVLGAAVSGCFFSYILKVPETRTWLAGEGITEIAVTTPNGKITVSSTAATTTTALITRICSGVDKKDAEKYIDNVKITEDVTGGILSLVANTPVSSLRNYAADFEITTPQSNILDLDTTNGSVTVTGMNAFATIRATNGKITANSHRGGIDALTENGNVDCDISLLAAADTVELETTNGNVVLSIPAAASSFFNASTTNGSVTVTGFLPIYSVNNSNTKVGDIGAGDAYIFIRTTNGNITIRAR